MNILNDYLKSVFTHEDTDNIPEWLLEELQSLKNTNLGANEVQEQLNELNIYNLHDQMICTQEHSNLSEVISCLSIETFDNYMSTGRTPADWKEANTTAIFKKGNRQEPGNHKPINLTFVIGKILERLTKARITPLRYEQPDQLHPTWIQKQTELSHQYP